jgi:hypothetical protein
MTQIFQEVFVGNKNSSASLRSNFRERISSKVGQYLYDVAQAWDAMDYEADERLLRQSFTKKKEENDATVSQRNWVPPLHIRRTLNQSYFSTVEDTEAMDANQVVYHQTRARKQKHQEGEERDYTTPQEGQFDGSSDTAVESPCTSVSDTYLTKKDVVKLVGITRVVMVDQLWMWILGEGKPAKYMTRKYFDRLTI